MARIEKEGLTDGALEALEVLEVGLHGSMIANMNNPLIETTAQRLKNYVTLIRLDRLVTAPRALRTLGEHIEILEAFVARDPEDRPSVVYGKSVSVCVDLGGRRIMKKKTTQPN